MLFCFTICSFFIVDSMSHVETALQLVNNFLGEPKELMALKLLFTESYNFIWSYSANIGPVSCALVVPLLSPSLSTCVSSVLERSLGSKMCLRIAMQIPCLLYFCLDLQNEMCLSCLSKIWFNSVFLKKEMLHLFRELTTRQVFSSKWWETGQWETGLMPSQFDGRVALLSARGIPPLFSLLCCYTEDKFYLCNSDLISYLVHARLWVWILRQCLLALQWQLKGACAALNDLLCTRVPVIS